MGQLTERSEPTMVMGGASFFLCRLEAVRHRENGWHEPYELRGSCTVLRGAGGEIPPAYSAMHRMRTDGKSMVQLGSFPVQKSHDYTYFSKHF